MNSLVLLVLLLFQSLRLAVDDNRVVVAAAGEDQVRVYRVAIVEEVGIDDVNSVSEAAECVGERPVDLAEGDPSIDLRSVGTRHISVCELGFAP
jgi:hypothetical protein